MNTAPSRGRTWLAAGGGAVLGAVLAVGLLVGLGWSADGSQASTSGELVLPDTADGLRLQDVVMEEMSDRPADELLAQGRAETAELLSASRGGAPAAAQTYADDELETRVTVWAVADESPSLWSAAESDALAESMRTKTPFEWVERGETAEDGSTVECLLRATNPALQDSDKETEAHVQECQLVTDGVTLILQGGNLDSIDRPVAILRDVASNLEQD
ncbi:hypothetical protein [Ornithinimicrobium faecis]|uniref:hypothetical protein n=1 Tax=Ornithinimicrobium faecis TaxID=2934158 RepID=UPI002118EFC5|nr:hypothetical protein [Ornithinimicrobium sp. HY1745]